MRLAPQSEDIGDNDERVMRYRLNLKSSDHVLFSDGKYGSPRVLRLLPSDAASEDLSVPESAA